jgi:hypothetical protein
MHQSLCVQNAGRPETHERGIDRSIGSVHSILRPPETFGILWRREQNGTSLNGTVLCDKHHEKKSA